VNISIIPEPELEFGNGVKHVDIRHGITHLKPFDIDDSRRPDKISVGIIGTPESIAGVKRWFQTVNQAVAAKSDSTNKRLFPSFPGYRKDTAFCSEIVLDDASNESIHTNQIVPCSQIKDYNKRIQALADLMYPAIKRASEKPIKVIVVAMPWELITLLADNDEPTAGSDDDEITVRQFKPKRKAGPQPEVKFIFHDLLKAKAMAISKPLQIIRPGTYDKTKRKTKKREPNSQLREVQDDATIAWNLTAALYYKAEGTPWKMPRKRGDFATCYVGISFYHSLDRKTVQVFDERGIGFVIRGGEIKLTKDDRTPHLDKKGAHELIKNAIQQYEASHRQVPARLVIHKTSKFNQQEIEGCEKAVKEFRIHDLDLLSLAPSFVRLFRDGDYPPLRGTIIDADETQSFLYTRGSIVYYEEYPGMYVPKTLQVRFDKIISDKRLLLEEILALTKMNWNNTQIDSLTPITIKAARQVGDILRYVKSTDSIQARYSFFM
jgi:hypothetical protein